MDFQKVAPGVVVDFNEAGTPVGIDIDHAIKLLDLTMLETQAVPLPESA